MEQKFTLNGCVVNIFPSMREFTVRYENGLSKIVGIGFEITIPDPSSQRDIPVKITGSLDGEISITPPDGKCIVIYSWSPFNRVPRSAR